MNESFINQYLMKFLSSNEEDAFHSLIEEGDDVVEIISVRLKQGCGIKAFKCFMELLREIRTEKSFKVLYNLCHEPFSECWVMATEALAYNNQDLAEKTLREHLRGLANEELLSKKPVVDGIFGKHETCLDEIAKPPEGARLADFTKDLADIDFLYTQILTVGFMMLRKALDSKDTGWAKMEAEFLHNIPSLIGERRWPRHDYFIDKEWKTYEKWASSPGREERKADMLLFYGKIMQNIAKLAASRTTRLPQG